MALHYAFTNVNGNVVGNIMDINLTNIPPLGEWVAGFYEPTGVAVLKPQFTQTLANTVRSKWCNKVLANHFGHCCAL
jgi:hypothetical protein